MAVLDLIGTFVFALAGATAGAQRRLDLFGIVVLAFVAGTFGGITRDVLIGAVPPSAVTEWLYIVVAVLAALLVFRFYALVDRIKTPVQVFDAVGLAVFAVLGTEKALAFGIGPLPAAMLGMLSGIGGGIARDLLLNDIPHVLRAELYALAALAGGAVVAVGDMLDLNKFAVAAVSMVVCFGLRYMAIRRRWHLPTVRTPQKQ